MTRKQRRLILIGSSLGVLAIAAALVLSALRESIVSIPPPISSKRSHRLVRACASAGWSNPVRFSAAII